MGKGKKNKKQDDDDWENDLDEIAKEAGIDLPQHNETDIQFVTKKEKKKKKGKTRDLQEEENDDDDNNDDVNKENENLPIIPATGNKKKKQKPSFSALILEDDDGDDDNDNNSDQASIEEEVPVVIEKTKNKKEKKKKGKHEDEDIDDLLNKLELDDKKEEKVSKKSKKKKKKEQEVDYTNDDEDQSVNVKSYETTPTEGTEDPSKETEVKKKDTNNDNNENEGEDGENNMMKTAAQKRAEKKERDKKKKEAEKKKSAKKKKKQETTEETDTVETTEETDTVETEKTIEESTEFKEKTAEEKTNEEQLVEGKEDTAEAKEPGEKEGESGEEEGDGETKDKKKKKKKKKDEDKDKGKKTKKPGKAALAKMQEALEEVKREEERLRAVAEAKEKALEEAEEARLEKLRLEKERKEKKKQKEKERKERLKKEGKFLTPAQKEQKRRAEAMLAAMKEQGIHVPTKDDTTTEKPKKFMYGKKKKQQKPAAFQEKQQQQQQVTEESKEKPVAVEAASETKKDDNVTDSWDAEEVDDVVHSCDTEKKTEEITVEKKEEPAEKMDLQKQVSRKSAQSVGDDGEEEEDEDEDEESSEEESSDENSEDSEEESDSDDDKKMTPEKIKERARDRIEMRKLVNESKRSTDVLRAPVICVLGHVDTGKTKILDKIRRTNVQDGEAGGITQQIGATNIPVEKIKEQTKMVKEFQKFDLKLPGLLVIDTPGHESFSNLRSRGSNLCDMAILVVDIMHGLEPQTIESINLLKKKQTPFVVALNKIDRLFEWQKAPNVQVEDTIKKQKKMTKQEYDERHAMIINQFAEQGLNAALHYQNPNEKEYISLVPTSAHSGDGMGDLMAIICRLTQIRLAKKLAYSDELESTVMEVKALPGLGTTIDVILVNGRLKEGDTMVTGGIDGAIVTQIRSVLTPQPMRELRVKAQYIHHQCLKAAQGVKLCGKDLEKVLAGSPLYVAQHPDEVEVLKEEVEEFVSSSLKAIKVSERGVYVQASTLGSLEALLEFLKTSKIPYCGVNIGPVHKRDVMRCSVMLEHEPMYAVVLAFDVKIERDAQEHADKEGITVFSAEIIYHLFDKFTAYCEEYKEKQREKFKHLAVYPCKLKVLPEHIFNSRDPIVIGVNIEAGTLRLGTPLVVPDKERVLIGFVTGIEANHKQLEKASSGQEVCVKIESVPGEAPKLYGRHFTHEDMICSRINRESIDVMKQYFREDMTKSDWQLTIELKKHLDIM